MKRDFPADFPGNPAPQDALLLSPRTLGLLEKKLAAQTVDGHHLVARNLKQLGVTHVYSVSGTPICETLAFCAEERIRPIGVRHQQGGVMMAVAQNYAAGRLEAVALVSAGPAVTNAATGILVARDNCWPVVVLGGRRPLSMRGMGSFQDLDGVAVFESITKWSAVVGSASEIPGYLRRAFKIATEGRPGPVYLDLPEDVLTETVLAAEFPSEEPRENPALDIDAVVRAADILRKAKRPMIIIGKGIRWSEPCQELSRLVSEWGIPFITSPMGRGYLPDNHQLCYNVVRGLVQSKSDAVLLVGARLDWTFRFGTEFAPGVKLIQVDICEQEIGANVTPKVGIVGDAKAVLRRLLGELESREGRNRKSDLASWHAVLDYAREKKRRDFESRMNSDSIPMSPYRMLKEVRDFLPRDAICVLDGNVFMAAAQQVLPAYLPASRFTAGTNGCMGVGIPFGIGAKLANPGRLVVIICGDAAFAFNAMEMETAVRHGIPVIVVVVNNEGISGALRQKGNFAADYGRVTMFQPAVRYERIVAAFGGHGEFVDHPDCLGAALERAVASGKAACVNVKVDPHAPYPQDA